MEQHDLFPPEMLLLEAQQRVQAGRLGRYGIVCPCCGQLAKVYKRKFTGAMARALIWLYRQGGDHRYIHVNATAPRFVLEGGGYFAMMRHWGLIEPAPEREDDPGRTSGRWGVTRLGVEFVLKRRAIPSHVHLYSNAVVGWSESTLTIATVLEGRFSYEELMAA